MVSTLREVLHFQTAPSYPGGKINALWPAPSVGAGAIATLDPSAAATPKEQNALKMAAPSAGSVVVQSQSYLTPVLNGLPDYVCVYSEAKKDAGAGGTVSVSVDWYDLSGTTFKGTTTVWSISAAALSTSFAEPAGASRVNTPPTTDSFSFRIRLNWTSSSTVANGVYFRALWVWGEEGRHTPVYATEGVLSFG